MRWFQIKKISARLRNNAPVGFATPNGWRPLVGTAQYPPKREREAKSPFASLSLYPGRHLRAMVNQYPQDFYKSFYLKEKKNKNPHQKINIGLKNDELSRYAIVDQSRQSLCFMCRHSTCSFRSWAIFHQLHDLFIGVKFVWCGFKLPQKDLSSKLILLTEK